MKGERIGVGRTAEVYTWGSHAILKLAYPGKSLGSEASNAKTIYDLGIPSPEVLDVIEIEGRSGIVYERIDGPTMMSVIETTAASITTYAKLLADLHYELHQVKIDHPPNYRENIKAGIEPITTVGEEEKQQVISYLEQLPEKQAICHFDLHPDNILMSKKGPVIIDWRDVLVGHPLSDVSWTSLLLRSNATSAGNPPAWLFDRSLRVLFHNTYLNTYFEKSPYDRNHVTRWDLPNALFRLGIILDEQVDLSQLMTE